MNMIGTTHGLATALSALALLASAALPGGAARAADDVLYVGDIGEIGPIPPTATDDDSIKRLDARTGAYLGTLVGPNSADDLIGPAGLVVLGQDLYVANQNTFQPRPSSVLKYSTVPGALPERVVPAQIVRNNKIKDNPDAPFAARGMILWNNNLFVASLVGNDNNTPGEVLKYTLAGTLVASLPRPPFSFHPRGVVIGPDEKLYVSNVQNLGANGGQVVRYSPDSGSLLDVFVSNDVSPKGKLRAPKGDCTDNLNRPEGLVFGPDGNLYITSFRAGVGDIDRILIFAGPQHARPGACLGVIPLDDFPTDLVLNPPRSFAQALLFGPGGVLFVPIANLVTGQAVKDSGAIRHYAVGGSNFPARRLMPDFVKSAELGGPLVTPFYLTFGKTDPATLAYLGD